MKMTSVCVMLLAVTAISVQLFAADYTVQSPKKGQEVFFDEPVFGTGRGPKTAQALSGFGHYLNGVVINESTTQVVVTKKGFWSTIHVPTALGWVFTQNDSWFSIIGPGKKKLSKAVVNGISVQ